MAEDGAAFLAKCLAASPYKEHSLESLEECRIYSERYKGGSLKAVNKPGAPVDRTLYIGALEAFPTASRGPAMGRSTLAVGNVVPLSGPTAPHSPAELRGVAGAAPACCSPSKERLRTAQYELGSGERDAQDRRSVRCWLKRWTPARATQARRCQLPALSEWSTAVRESDSKSIVSPCLGVVVDNDCFVAYAPDA